MIATTYQPMASVAAFRFDNSFARELQGFYVPWRPAAVPAPRLLFLNYSLAAELGLDVSVARWARDGSDICRKLAARRRRTAGSGLRRSPVRWVLTPTWRRPRAAYRRGDRPAGMPSRHRLQGLGPHAIRPRWRRQGRSRADAARGADRRGDARAGHPHDARPRGRGDGRAGLPRTRAAGRRADTRGGKPHPSRDLRVLCLAR